MTRPHVVIIGAGFGGLFAARELAGQDVDVLVIDRNNFHTFTPLLYQVATCALDPSEVAYPVRSIFMRNANIRFLLGEVTNIDTTNRQVTVKANGDAVDEAYDYLLVAAGSTPTYFGNEAFRQHTFELHSLKDAVDLRNHVLRLFERAAWSKDYSERDKLTTIVIVGGGPTGIETAGAIYELYNHVLQHEYRHTHLRARVILIEMQSSVLTAYPERLQRAAFKQLNSLGVEVMLGHRVDQVAADHIVLDNNVVIPTHTLIWSAGVRASPLGELLGVELTRNGQVSILPTTEICGLDHVYAIGDIAHLENPHGQPYPMLIPVAQQQASLAAQNIMRHIAGQEQQSFAYHDRGTMATIGRNRAVAWIYNRFQLTGWLAWIAWLGLHLVTLLGFRNQIAVFFTWVWNYFTYDRSVRIILEKSDRPR